MTPRSGRPSGGSDARTRILDSARKLFAAKGFQQATLRAIAADAGVDVALIGHYFEHKRGLFLAVIELPVDPEDVATHLQEVPLKRVGSEFLRHVMTIWSSPAGPGVVAAFRSSLTGDDEILREFIGALVFPAIRGRLEGSGVADLDRRIPLAATQIAGVLMLRQVLELEPLASMPIEEVVRAVGPNVDRVLLGDID